MNLLGFLVERVEAERELQFLGEVPGARVCQGDSQDQSSQLAQELYPPSPLPGEAEQPPHCSWGLTSGLGYRTGLQTLLQAPGSVVFLPGPL